MKNRKKSIICPNCNQKLQVLDNYCPNCGQENHTHKIPVKNFIVDFLASSFNFDTKIFTTLRDLIIKPGLITKNYNQNRRARYVTPIKFYIFVSFIFFFILFKFSGFNTDGSSIKFTYKFIDDLTTAQDLDKLRKHPNISEKTLDLFLDSLKIQTNWINRSFYHNYIKAKIGLIPGIDMVKKIIQTFSTMLFILMPLFALLLLLFHYKLKRYYSEHLVFSIHLHSFIFLALSVCLILGNFIPGLFFLSLLPLLYIYCIKAFRKVYEQSITLSAFKVFFIGLLYFAFIAASLIPAILISFF
jgi:hypothetical protein